MFVMLLAGCGGSAEEQSSSMTAETTEAAGEMAATPLSDYAGDWTIQAQPLEGDEVLVEFGMTATDSTGGWTVQFDHLAEPISGEMVTVEGDSVSFSFGPYSSALQDDIMVTTVTTMHAEGGQVDGHFTATYANGDVLHGRVTGTRNP